MFDANLVILAQIYEELSHEQAEFPRILSQNDLEGLGKWPPFSIPAEGIQGCMFGANFVVLAQICEELSRGQSEFPRILSQNGQMTLKVKVNDFYFQHQPRVSQDACLMQIWRFQFNSVTSYRADKVKFTDKRADGRTDRWTDAGNDNTPSACKVKG